MYFIFVMANLNLQHHYSSLQSHDPSEIILIKTVDSFFTVFEIYRKFKRTAFTVSVYNLLQHTFTFDQFNASLLNKSILSTIKSYCLQIF